MLSVNVNKLWIHVDKLAGEDYLAAVSSLLEDGNSVTDVHFSYAADFGAFAKEIFQFFFDLANKTNVSSLGYNGSNDLAIDQLIVENLFQCEKIKRFDISYSYEFDFGRLGRRLIQMFSQSLFSNQQFLIDITVYLCPQTTDQLNLEPIFLALSLNGSLKSLSIRCQGTCSDDISEQMGNMLSQNCVLEKFSLLNANNVVPLYSKAKQKLQREYYRPSFKLTPICEGLRRNTMLKELDLSDNFLTFSDEAEFNSVVRMLTDNGSLIKFDISEPELTRHQILHKNASIFGSEGENEKNYKQYKALVTNRKNKLARLLKKNAALHQCPASTLANVGVAQSGKKKAEASERQQLSKKIKTIHTGNP